MDVDMLVWDFQNGLMLQAASSSIPPVVVGDVDDGNENMDVRARDTRSAVNSGGGPSAVRQAKSVTGLSKAELTIRRHEAYARYKEKVQNARKAKVLATNRDTAKRRKARLVRDEEEEEDDDDDGRSSMIITESPRAQIASRRARVLARYAERVRQGRGADSMSASREIVRREQKDRSRVTLRRRQEMRQQLDLGEAIARLSISA
ncbi:hypothetical protein OE88DRAFT_1731959 [Heliocybe sulcata]|uniref:Uncharacterized protein n=1 Tax=Heliocybe sulcata TaxID=5364 RepID=A0A5C3NBB6_9AGAM|nr:hypothetical protein OE88DRAFT_1731959 [Heliocybe sulcata]